MAVRSIEDFKNLLTDVSGNNQVSNRSFESDGFIVPSTPGGDGFSLPSGKVQSDRQGRAKRNMMHWFVPEVGVVKMYINPNSVNYSFKKLIVPERTKGGYVIQYWGEELPTLTIQGSTGSSGIEGINVLEEIYRAEQYNFDSIGLTLASNNVVSGLADSINNGSFLGSLTGGILDVNPISQSILPKNIPSLASMAFGVELYWSGWVFRGFFSAFSFDERADAVGLFNYNMQFTVIQRRGYRYNFMPWHHSANDGPSNHDSIKYSFDDSGARAGRQISNETIISNNSGTIGSNSTILKG